MFSALSKIDFKFSVITILLSSNTFNLDQSKILLFGNGLMCKYYHINYIYIVLWNGLTLNPEEKAFENIVGKGENAGNQHFLLFPQSFLH